MSRWAPIEHPLDIPAGNAGYLDPPRTCPLCAGAAYRPLVTLPDFLLCPQQPDYSRRQGRLPHLQHVQCRTCGFCYMNPCFSGLGLGSLLETPLIQASFANSGAHLALQEHYLQRYRLLKPGSRVVEMGCGSGALLARLPDDMHREGIDSNGAAIQTAQATHGSATLQFLPWREWYCRELFLQDRQQTRGPDLFLLLHTLEHIPDPAGPLRVLRELSHPETTLVIEVPVMDWPYTTDIHGFFCGTGHVSHFSIATLRALLAACGWQELPEIPLELSQSYNGARLAFRPGQPFLMQRDSAGEYALAHQRLAQWQEICRQSNTAVQAIPPERQGILWGAGVHTEMLWQLTALFHDVPARDWLLVDRDPQKHGLLWRGLTIYPPEIVQEDVAHWGDVFLVPSSYGGQESICAAAAQLGFPPSRLLRLYENVHSY